jgi:hypothetical protein
MKRLDENQLKETLKQAPWDTAFVNDDIDDVVNVSEQTLNCAIDSHCPWREKRVKQNTQAPWMTKTVIKQLHIRDHLLKVARRTDNSDDWANYRVARNKAVSILRSAKREFYNNSFEENKNNKRAIWKSIKTLTGAKNNTRQIKNLKIDGREVDDKTEMAEQFNTYFSTVAEKIRRHLSTVPFDLFKLVNFVKSRKNDQEVNFCFSYNYFSGH